MQAADPLPSIVGSSLSLADSILFCIRSIWKTPTLVTWRGSVAGRFYISRERCVSRTSRNHRQEVFPALYRLDSQEEFRSLLLEECTRMAKSSRAILEPSWADAVVSSSWAIRRSAQILLDFGEQLLQLPWGRSCAMASQAVCSRHPDTEAFRRPLGGYFRDRFTRASRARPKQLSVSSFRLTRSALRLTAAECSCIRRRPSSPD